MSNFFCYNKTIIQSKLWEFYAERKFSTSTNKMTLRNSQLKVITTWNYNSVIHFRRRNDPSRSTQSANPWFEGRGKIHFDFSRKLFCGKSHPDISDFLSDAQHFKCVNHHKNIKTQNSINERTSRKIRGYKIENFKKHFHISWFVLKETLQGLTIYNYFRK